MLQSGDGVRTGCGSRALAPAAAAASARPQTPGAGSALRTASYSIAQLSVPALCADMPCLGALPHRSRSLEAVPQHATLQQPTQLLAVFTLLAACRCTEYELKALQGSAVPCELGAGLA